jgi:hypothetical protein
MIRYICAQPANNYYTWQVETLIHNFLKHGINGNHMDILLSYQGEVDDVWRKLQREYPYIRFFFYPDTREDTKYIPGIYFNLMKQHLKEHPELENEVLFTHDSDIVFTRPVDWSHLTEDDTWYLSDTNSYINYEYIMQKGEYILDGMCEIVGIDKDIVKENNLHSGGAQYIVKNTHHEMWDKIESDSYKLYNYFLEIEPEWVKNNKEGAYPIQKWTAGMWSYLWNGWYYGHKTEVHPSLNFGWVTNKYDDVLENSILHNSGVLNGNNGLFYKGQYVDTLPYGQDLDIDKEKASYYYYQQVQEAGQKSCLLK